MRFFYTIIALITLLGILYFLMLNVNIINALNIGNTSGNIVLASPVDKEVYYKIKVQFNLSSDNVLHEIKYANLMDKDTRCGESERFENTCWKILCIDCNGYGNEKERKLTLNQGINELVIRVIDSNSSIIYFNITVFVESIKPKIISTNPRNNKIINGSDFTIAYTEYNLKSITLVYGNNDNYRNLTKDCASGKTKICIFSLNLTEYENQAVYYYFILNNLIYTIQSQSARAIVDTISPVLTIHAPLENKHYFKKTQFNISVSEFSKIEYMDKTDKNPVWRSLCTNCNKFGFEKIYTKSMLKGNHNVLIRAIDKAGNSDVKEVSFEID